jgi:hypothetical protein
MSQQLTLTLSDKTYQTLQSAAQSAGIPLEQWILNQLSPSHSYSDPVQARQAFQAHAGSLSLGYATGSDNDTIEADLAQAYES